MKSNILVRSWIKVDDDLVPVELFGGPVVDEEYIEGAIELTINGVPLLTCEQVDYVDQLWAYIVHGMEEVCAGREFTTDFPDMPVEVSLKPDGANVAVRVASRASATEATTTISELVRAMAPAAVTLFERLAPHVVRHRGPNDRLVEDVNRVLRTVTAQDDEAP